MSKSAYQKLLRAFRSKPHHSVKLWNFYFDDPSLKLRKKRYALRVRIVENGRGTQKAFCTLKYPAKPPKKQIRALKIRVEHEVLISSATAANLLKAKKHISELDLKPLRILKRQFTMEDLKNVGLLGQLFTRRTYIPIAPKLELELDRFKIYDKRFYELEVETERPEYADRTVRALMEKHNIPFTPITRSKYARFVAEWKRRR